MNTPPGHASHSGNQIIAAPSSAGDGPPVEKVTTALFEVPTDHPEGDGTIAWSSTAVVVVEVHAAGHVGTGWTYCAKSAQTVVQEKLSSLVQAKPVFDVPAAWQSMVNAVRNMGRPGVVSCAISAVDIALWDLKARVMGVSLASLFGRLREGVPIYGSGGFTTYQDDVTIAQLEQWVAEWHMDKVKIKIGESWGSNPGRDLHRAQLARKVIGDDAELFVDANGGYNRKQAVRMGHAFYDEAGVTWFEEPVSSDDLDGLREVRDNCLIDVAAGEYGYSPWYFAQMIGASAIDCLQVDVTRCGGFTAWAQVAGLAAASNMDISGHCAPNLSAHIAVSAPNLRHLEYFHDHHRIENMLFDGALSPAGGVLTPDTSRAGHGMRLRTGLDDLRKG
ncbi:MAG TPA: enolase C-terminal domain-like protein [Acidimicrobiales bacterium]|nr:enolase C-terminal domain-like protein [Acidimicrobiales bacterium]